MLYNGNPFSYFVVPCYNNRVSIIDQSKLMGLVDQVRNPEPHIVKALVKAARKAGHRVDRNYRKHMEAKVANYVALRPILKRTWLGDKRGDYIHANNFLNAVFTYPAQPTVWAAFRHLVGW